MAEKVKKGDTISVHYTGKFEDGEMFDSSKGQSPLIFTVGAGQLIPGFDKAVIDMSPGEKKMVTVPPAEGYGEHNKELIVEFPRTGVPEEMELAVGMQVQLKDKDGNPAPAVVTAFNDETVNLDVNHPLAGKTLVFDIEVVETGLAPQCGGTAGCGSCCGACDD